MLKTISDGANQFIICGAVSHKRETWLKKMKQVEREGENARF